MSDLKEHLVAQMQRIQENVRNKSRRSNPWGEDKCFDCSGTRWTQGEGGLRQCTRCAPTADKRLIEAGVPSVKLSASLVDNVHPQNRDIASALRDVIELKLARPEGGVYSMIFTGTNGTGKTHMAAACLRYAVETHRWRVRFVTVRNLVRELQQVYQTDDRDACARDTLSVMATCERPTLLALNELPRTRPTPFVVEAIEGLLDHRLDEGLPTIITTNLELSEIEALYGSAVSSRLGRVKGDRPRLTVRAH